MGLFKRKDSKNSSQSETENESFVTVNSARTSNTSLRSPGYKGSGPPASIPELPIARPPDPALDPAAYLRSVHAVRERSNIILNKAKKNQLSHFDVDMSKFEATASYVVSIIKRDYAPDYENIPPHGRWQHFDVGGRPRINQLLQSWPSRIDAQERTRRLIDLFVVSVLLDAVFSRSEGLAVASLEMFKSGLFSSDPTEPCQVDGAGLKKVTTEVLAKGMQHTDQNPLAGIEGRAGLLIRLSEALNNQDFFGVDARPGNMLDYLLGHPSTLASSIDGVSIGDAWKCSGLPKSPPAQQWESILPFHKLTQWLCYSIMVPMSKLMLIHFAGSDLLTGLPEYRNGGLLIDLGLLTLKPDDMQRGIDAYKENAQIKGQPSVEVAPLFCADDDVIVEWRGATGSEEQLSLAQMLEAGTWKGGREIAEVSRPNTKEPPIMIRSDGTVF
ncbi:hypothetical protein N7453_001352 [Penicillium expansum]|nr:hypothetical protein N7453_001352 [Penicillium expansum]